MRFQNRVSRPCSNGSAVRLKRQALGGQQRRKSIDSSVPHYFCRRLKARVIAIPNSTAARFPKFLAAGFILNPRQSLSRDDSSLSASHGQSIDWRICGDQDANAEE